MWIASEHSEKVNLKWAQRQPAVLLPADDSELFVHPNYTARGRFFS
jgi:hypothetical protein